MKIKPRFLIFCSCLLLQNIDSQAQAEVRETIKNLKTYAFSDPDPVPKIGRFYPYFRFDGYTDIPEMKDWKFVELENAYIKVAITPQIGGKVWGAIEKSSGFPFVYYNNVVKFRDVAMRGAWTSGGIELNFGDIGHAPTVSNPVDYLTRTNPDGSVSCFVGAWDWASRTRWTVEINLPKDKAFFTTKSRWFNASPLETSYYHWMNAGFKAAGNLEFAFQGTNFVGHGGEVGPWTTDSLGRKLNFYEQNNFGTYKSYHIVGKQSDFYGGYWHNDKTGFVHYSPSSEKFGQKIWIWGLSQQGMIWEKLLTDTDGQYVELQSGRLFNQAAPESIKSPFKHLSFMPYASDSWTENWYPVKNTGGITTANQLGALKLKQTPTHLVWTFCPVETIDEKFVIKADNQVVFEKKVAIKPLENYADSATIPQNKKLIVSLGETVLLDESQPSATERPLTSPADFDWNSEYGLYLKGKDLANQRSYLQAEEWFDKCLQKNNYFVPALGELSQLKYRKGLYAEALKLADKALSINTYDPLANYMRGLASQRLNKWTIANDGFSVAALSPQFRAASLTELAKIATLKSDLLKAERLINQALEHQPTNDHARHLQIIILRKTNRKAEALKWVKVILNENPLDHFARFEGDLLLKTNELGKYITNELPHEDYLEMAHWYCESGLYEDALELLKNAPPHVFIKLWAIDTDRKKQLQANEVSMFHSDEVEQLLASNSKGVFPSRAEDIGMLDRFEKSYKIIQKPIPWQLSYYQGITLWSLGCVDEAKSKFITCEIRPDVALFYLAKAELFKKDGKEVQLALERAYNLEPQNWRVVKALADFYATNGQSDKALTVNEARLGGIQKQSKAQKFEVSNALTFHEKYILGQQRAQLLAKLGRFEACINFMKTLQLLPNEGAKGAHDLYREANIRYAIELLKTNKLKEAIAYLNQAETWPENLGSGAPYDPDNRLTTALRTYATDRLKSKDTTTEALQKSVNEFSKADQELLTSFLSQ